MSPHGSIFCYVLSIAGPIFFMSMQLSYLQTAWKIVSIRSDLRLSPLPFVSLITNCSVMSMYAILRSNSTIFVPNFTGLLTGLVCTCAFQTYTKETKSEVFMAAGCILLLAFYLAFIGEIYHLGLVGVCLSVILMGSPLATLRTVVREKSTNSLPFLTSATTFLNALSWALYGVIEVDDPIVYIPNIIGLLLASVQLSLFVVYGMPSEIETDNSYDLVDLAKSADKMDENVKTALVKCDKKIINSYV